MRRPEVYVFNVVPGLTVIGIVIAEGVLVWPWSVVIIGVVIVGGAAVLLPSLLALRIVRVSPEGDRRAATPQHAATDGDAGGPAIDPLETSALVPPRERYPQAEPEPPAIWFDAAARPVSGGRP
jgi:hypothetical protein